MCSVYASMQVYVLPVKSLTFWVHEGYEAIGGHVPQSGVAFDPVTLFLGRGRRSKVRPCQLMRQTTALVHCRAGKKATKVWGWCGYEEVGLPCSHRK